MENQLATGGVIVIFAWLVINKVFDYLKARKNGNGKDNYQDNRLTKVETLFEEHCKVQSETFATIHNGLNTNTNSVKEMSDKLTRLETIIDERIPKKV